MSNNTFVSVKRKALLARKEKILEELKYYERRIQDQQSTSKIEYYLDDDTSDSDDDLGITADLGPSIMQLKLDQSKLRTCLQATQELTNLQILQSEVSVIVNDPVLNREPPVKEPGVWREVTAECRIDLIPFSITFYTHKSNAKFGAMSYRGLQVILVKAAHEAELSKSVLPTLVRPSDALEVLRSYAEAYRSRRSTLARLGSKYADSLYMEPMAEGGYLLKCANLLQVAWRLENKSSPLASFHHRMKFDLEYMEEEYINIITQSHKQLSNPTISTDERTLLLSKIIATCLEAKPVSESADSDKDTRLPKRRATLDQEIEEPELKKKKEVMAPPKSLPKKSKVSKTVTDRSKPNDSSSNVRPQEGNGDAEKENVDSNSNTIHKNVTSDKVSNKNKSVVSGSKSAQKQTELPKNVINSKDVESSKDKGRENIVDELDPKNKNRKIKVPSQHINLEKQSANVEKLIQKPLPGKKSDLKDKTKKNTINNNNGDGANKKNTKVVAQTKISKTSEEPGVTTNKKKKVTDEKNGVTAVEDGKSSAKKNRVNDEGGSNNKNVDTVKTNYTDADVAKTTKKARKDATDVNNVPKTVQASVTKEKTAKNATEKAPTLDTAHKVVEKNIATNKNKDKIADIVKKGSTKTVASLKNKVIEANKNTDSVNKEIVVEANIESSQAKSSGEIKKGTNKKSVTNDKNKVSPNTNAANVAQNITEKEKTRNSQEKFNKGCKNIKNTDQTKKSVLPVRLQNNMKMVRKSIGTINTKALNVAKENAGSSIKSKIPQKKLSPLNEKILKKNPLRMSPRHIASTFNSTSSLASKLSIQKSTNIPRLTKPMFRAK